jgi:NADPH:quinone reductase
MEKLPKQYQAVVLPNYNTNVIRAMLGLKIEEKDIPVLRAGEVLVKIEAAAINPSDIAFLQGGYNIVKSLPCVPGFEASGRVVGCGASTLAQGLKGKKVSCFTQRDTDGTWADYFVCQAKDCLPLKEEMPIEQAACFTINPFTAFGMFEKAIARKSKAIILNAAGSQLCSYMRSLAKLNGVKVINIVRKAKTATDLKLAGAENVLLSSDEGFETKLEQMAHQLDAKLAFDAVGGEMTGALLKAMPPCSELVLYGGLSGKPIENIGVLDIIFQNKILSGFNLGDWIKSIGNEKFLKISGKLQDMFIEGVLKTEIQGRFELNNVVKALRQYLGNMSEGKVLLVSKEQKIDET